MGDHPNTMLAGVAMMDGQKKTDRWREGGEKGC